MIKILLALLVICPPAFAIQFGFDEPVMFYPKATAKLEFNGHRVVINSDKVAENLTPEQISEVIPLILAALAKLPHGTELLLRKEAIVVTIDKGPRYFVRRTILAAGELAIPKIIFIELIVPGNARTEQLAKFIFLNTTLENLVYVIDSEASPLPADGCTTHLMAQIGTVN